LSPRPPSSPCRELDEGGSDNGNSTRIRKCLAGDPENPQGFWTISGWQSTVKSVSTASTTRRRSGPGRTYLAQIDVSLRAVGRETLTRLGNSRATAAVTLLLLLLYSAPQARTKVPSPILCLSVGHHPVLTACLLSPCWVSARVSSHFPVPHLTVPLPLEDGWGHKCTLLLRGCHGLAGHTARSSQDSHASRILSMYSRTLPLPWYRPCHLSSEARLSLLGSSNVAWSSALLSCTAGQG
jgi:hypothetical protein